jgi:hypothetical protein
MASLRICLFMILTLSASMFSIDARAQLIDEVPNAYDVQFSVSVDGNEVANPQMLLAEGKPGLATLVNPKNDDQGVRIQVVATSAPPHEKSGGIKTVKVDLMILEKVAGAWVEISRPSILSEDGKEGHVKLEGDGRSIAVRIKATGQHSELANSFAPKLCTDETVPSEAVAKDGPQCPQAPM